jgi:hypothetical protein
MIQGRRYDQNGHVEVTYKNLVLMVNQSSKMRKRKMRRDAGKMEQLRREMGSERGQRIVLQIKRVRLEPEALSKQGDFRTGFVATGYCTTHACWQWRVGALAWVVSMEALSIAHQAASTLQILQENAHRLQV